LLPGGALANGDLYGFAAIRYDRRGVLWAARNLVFALGRPRRLHRSAV
jgi:hypothetical protein